MRLRVGIFLSSLFLLTAAGCGGDEFAGKRCTVKQSLIDEAPSCVEDDDCPCGSGCTLGVCEAECRRNGDCGSGERCNDFGRCVPGLSGFIPVLEIDESPVGLIVSTSTLESQTGIDAQTFTVRAPLDAQEATTLRVAAQAGLSIHCADIGAGDVGQASSAPCELGMEEGIDIVVVPDEALAPGESLSISLHWNNIAEEVSYYFPDDSVQFAEFDPSGAPTGLYEGVATLSQVGAGFVPPNTTPAAGLDGTTGGVDATAEISIPITLEVFGAAGDFQVRLHDTLGALAPAGTIEAQLADDGNGNLEFIADSHAFIESAFATEADDENRGFGQVNARYGHRVEVAGALTGDTVWPTIAATELNDGFIELELPVYFDTLRHPQRAPTAVWKLALGRVSAVDAASQAPAAPSGDADVHAPAMDGKTRLALTRWEADLAPKTVDAQSLGSAFTGVEVDGVGACTNGRAMTSTEKNALYQEVINRVLGEMLFDEPNGDTSSGEVTVSYSGSGTIAAAGPIPAQTGREFMRVFLGVANTFSVGLSYTMHASHPVTTRTIVTDGEPIEHLDVPCAFSGRMQYIHVNSNQNSVNSGALSADICDELSARTGCVIHSRSGTFASLRASDFETFGNPGTSFFTNSVFRDQTGANFGRFSTRFCTMPEVPLVCTDVVSCHSGDEADLTDSSLLVDNFFSETGDAICEGSLRSLAIDADESAEERTAGELFAACTAELEAAATRPAPENSLSETLSAAKCFNLSRFLTALGAASQELRVRDVSPITWPEVDSAEHMTHRLLVQWVRTHGFIASEMNQQFILQEILRRDPVAGVLAPPTLEVVLPTSLRGWDLLLHPRYSNALDNVSGETLAASDYRIARFGGSVPTDAENDPAESLSEAMLDTLRSQAELATLLLEQARLRGDSNAISFVSPVIRYAVLVDSVAEELAGRAVAACELDQGLCNGATTPPWFARYERAGVRMNVAIQKMVASANALLAGQNPLGIEESDLPLYFANTPETDDGRFFAISDYFIGASPNNVRAWAPPLIDEAERHLQSARSKWVERQDRVVATQRDDLARVNRVVDAMTDYGDRIINLCGSPENGLISGDALFGWEAAHGRPFNANDCFFDLGNPECRFDQAISLDLFSNDEARYSVCHFREIDRLSAGRASYAEPGLTEFARDCEPSDVSYQQSGCAASPTGACLTCADGSVADVAISGGNFLEVLVDPSADLSLINAADDPCRSQFPNAVVPLPTIQDKTGDVPVDCFRGAIGEQAAALRSIATEIDIARRELTELINAYDLAVSACDRQRLTGQQLIDAQEDHNEELTTLRAIKLAADIAAAVAGGVKDCADSAGSDNKGASPATCAAAAVETVAVSVSHGMQFAIDQAESAFALETLNIETEGEHAVCKIESKQYVVGVQSQGLRIQRALEDLDAANVVFSNLRAAATQAFDDGLATVAFEQDRRLSPLTQDLWLDEDVQAFDRSFRIARRVTYLAVAAVEYEFQQSIGLRGTVLVAELPADLNAVLRELRTFTGGRTVFGSRPTKRKAILSLRDQLLDLEDRVDVPANEINMTAIERLQLRLRSPKNAVFDESGRYLGQEISFSLAAGEVGPDIENSAQIFSQDSCAERLWSVNASVLGGEDLLFGQASTFTNITIKKANTFYSQWCDGDDEDVPYQLASVRPERNLFRDPEGPGASFIESQLSALRGSNFSKALIQPSLNVDRINFEDDQFENGESSQLAARGLFGEYTIFFPAQALSILSNSSQSEGLDLSKVEDVLIRFDYLAAAR